MSHFQSFRRCKWIDILHLLFKKKKKYVVIEIDDQFLGKKVAIIDLNFLEKDLDYLNSIIGKAKDYNFKSDFKLFYT
jgi:hypothetical protein